MPQAISLGIGEPDFVTPWHIREAAIFALEELAAWQPARLTVFTDSRVLVDQALGRAGAHAPGLKARLVDHVETIEHPDIRALYKRELLERFSAFAFPPRPQREWKPGGFSQRTAAPKSLSSDAVARLRRAMSGGARDALTSAVFAGLARFPHEVERHTEPLSRLARLDPKTTEMVESLFEYAETLDSRAEEAISGERGLPAPPEPYRYAFLREGTDPVDAREELAEAVSLLVERPALKAALAAAGARFDEDPEEAFAEQTRLRERLIVLEERLKTFGRKKAANAADLDTTRTSAQEPVSDLETD